METETELTDEQAEAMLRALSKHFREPVQPISRYCRTLEVWASCIVERARRLQEKVLPNLHDWGDKDRTAAAQAQHEELQKMRAKQTLKSNVPVIFSMLSKESGEEVAALLFGSPTPREVEIEDFIHMEQESFHVERTFLAIRKSNLLARLLHNGEKLRTKMCPEHEGTWSGIEFGSNVCPHKCQLTGWVQEEDDQGKPLPGVQAVQILPTGPGPNDVTVIRSVDGEVLGKATMHTIPKPESS